MGEQDGMRQFLDYHRRMFAVMALACAAALAGLAAAGFRGDWSWTLGFGVGAAAQLAKFRFIDAAAVQRLAAAGSSAAAEQLKATLCSLFVFGLAVAAAYALGGNVWALAAGIFLPRVILVADAWLRPNPFGSDNAE